MIGTKSTAAERDFPQAMMWEVLYIVDTARELRREIPEGERFVRVRFVEDPDLPATEIRLPEVGIELMIAHSSRRRSPP
jgi:hypothetical protein